jgi:flagellar basal body rod protein FlgG
VTRAGALTRDAQGRLVLATSGAAILGIDGNPITLEGQSADLLVDASGSVFQGGQEIGRLQLVMPADLATLRKEGRDALRIAGGKTVAAPAGTSIRQRALEESTVDSVATLAELMRISRGIDFSMRLMQYQDQMTGRMVEAFGRFA